jgi:hypothetical protein
MELLIAFLGVIILIPILLFYSSLVWGFVVSKFYVWFILSVFPTFPQISVLYFIGIMFFLSAVLPKTELINIKKEYKDTAYTWLVPLISPWVVLFCGFILHSFY